MRFRFTNDLRSSTYWPLTSLAMCVEKLPRVRPVATTQGRDAGGWLDEGLASAFTCFGIDEAMETGRVIEMSKYWKMVKQVQGDLR